MKPWVKTLCIGCSGVALLALLTVIVLSFIFVKQSNSEILETVALTQQVMPATATESFMGGGLVVLSISSGALTVEAGPVGQPIRVESNFDTHVYRLEHNYEELEDGRWIYRVDFHAKRALNIAVLQAFMGTSSPEVQVTIPRDLQIELETVMRGGNFSADLGGMNLTTASVDLERGLLELTVSEPLETPLERLTVHGQMGVMNLHSLGNASPERLDVQFGMGNATVDLNGTWLNDGDVNFEMSFGDGLLKLPGGVNIVIDGNEQLSAATSDLELPAPTLHISAHFDMGDIRIVD